MGSAVQEAELVGRGRRGATRGARPCSAWRRACGRPPRSGRRGSAGGSPRSSRPSRRTRRTRRPRRRPRRWRGWRSRCLGFTLPFGLGGRGRLAEVDQDGILDQLLVDPLLQRHAGGVAGSPSTGSCGAPSGAACPSADVETCRGAYPVFRHQRWIMVDVPMTTVTRRPRRGPRPRRARWPGWGGLPEGAGSRFARIPCKNYAMSPELMQAHPAIKTAGALGSRRQASPCWRTPTHSPRPAPGPGG